MTLATFLSHVVNALINGSFYGLIGAGFGIILGVTGRFHFAYSTTFMGVTYAAALLVSAGVPLVVALLVALVLGIATGVVIEAVVYRPVVAKSETGGLLAVFVSALGVAVVAENAVRLIWGSRAKTVPTGFTVSSISLGGGITITTLDIVIVGVSWLVIVALWTYLRRSGRGRAIRAVQANPDMASVVGINPNGVFLIVFGVGSLLCGIGALLFAMRFATSPDVGVQPTFLALVVAFVAGPQSGPLRFGLTGLGVALIQSLATIWISQSWNSVAVFGVLFVYVGLRPVLAERQIRFRFKVASLKPASGRID